MKLIKTVFVLTILVVSSPLFSQNEIIVQKTEPFVIGESIEFHSTILDENRSVNIYLPNGYSPDSLKKYPVIYLLDGSTDEDFIHIAGLVQFGSFSWINMVPESIVVGIANVDRKRDFTYPTKIRKLKKDFPTTGGSENFIHFIEQELQPLINQQYKVDTITTLIGQSLGGLLATEILFKRPDLFSNYIIISPSLWWDKESLASYEPKEYSSNKLIYIGVGQEGEIMERVANELYQKLQALNRKNTTLFFHYFEEQNHGDALHLSVYDAFEKMFKKEEG